MAKKPNNSSAFEVALALLDALEVAAIDYGNESTEDNSKALRDAARDFTRAVDSLERN